MNGGIGVEIVIKDRAMDWFKQEMEVEIGDSIRFYARYGGSSPFHEAFSLGMNREQPHQVGLSTEIDGILFYIEQDDLWFFNDHSLIVSVDAQMDELTYSYEQ
jgi:uncharacterized protein YneR